MIAAHRCFGSALNVVVTRLSQLSLRSSSLSISNAATQALGPLLLIMKDIWIDLSKFAVIYVFSVIPFAGALHIVRSPHTLQHLHPFAFPITRNHYSVTPSG